jgi:hypothetical protein
MRPRDFFKSLLLLAVVAISIFYVASSFFIAKTVADVLRPSDIIAVQLDVASVESLRGETRDGHQGTPSDVSGKKRDDVRIIAKHSQNPSAVARLRASAATMVQFAVFLGLLIVPCWIFYRFLFKPLKEFPIVAPGVLEDLKSDKSVVQENAARIVAKAMMVSVERELRALKRGDDRLDELKNDREKLSEALHKAIGGARIILGMLEQRENRAKIAARKFALMAGLTVAISSSAMGDGLGMFFWKARLVHDTIRIYGFRPGAWAVLRIYAYVVFAVFLATSIEDLCEILDVSDLLGGFGVRVLQGVVGGAVVLKGGQLSRAYLMHGISERSRKAALKEFRSTESEELKSLGGELKDYLATIGLKIFQPSETVLSDVVGG